jgi:hypothetical protein
MAYMEEVEDENGGGFRPAPPPYSSSTTSTNATDDQSHVAKGTSGPDDFKLFCSSSNPQPASSGTGFTMSETVREHAQDPALRVPNHLPILLPHHLPGPQHPSLLQHTTPVSTKIKPSLFQPMENTTIAALPVATPATARFAARPLNARSTRAVSHICWVA